MVNDPINYISPYWEIQQIGNDSIHRLMTPIDLNLDEGTELFFSQYSMSNKIQY